MGRPRDQEVKRPKCTCIAQVVGLCREVQLGKGSPVSGLERFSVWAVWTGYARQEDPVTGRD